MTVEQDAYNWGRSDGYDDQPYGAAGGCGWDRQAWKAYSDGYADGKARREKEMKKCEA